MFLYYTVLELLLFFFCHSCYNYLILNCREKMKRLMLWEKFYVYWIQQDTHQNAYILIIIAIVLVLYCGCFFLYINHYFYNYLILNLREKRLICEKNCMWIECDRTLIETYTYLSLCLRPFNEYQINCRLVVSMVLIPLLCEVASILLKHITCTFMPLGECHLLYVPLTWTWYHLFDLK